MKFPSSRVLVWAVLFVPLLVLCWQYVTGALFYGEFIHITGDWSARLLILTLLVTPLRGLVPRQRWTAWLVRQRRYLGGATFAYAVPHLVAYLVKLADMARILSEGIEPGMLTGWVAMLIFLALAITSNNISVRKLGKRWKSLHRLVYAAAILTFLHWILLAFDPLQGYIHAGILLVVQALRFVKLPRSASHSE
jgi:sulfoxide reductase heme-binding subunit YedZ